MDKTTKAILFGIVAALILLLIAVSASSCKTIQPTTITRDSIVTYTRHDTIVTQERDSASINALLRCDSNYNVILEELATSNGERIRLSAMLKQVNSKENDKKKLYSFDVECKEDSLQHRIEWLEKQVKASESKTIVVTEKVTPKWAWWSLIACIVMIAGIVIRVLIRIYLRR